MMFPKHRRVESPKALAAYCLAHPRCEVLGCAEPPMPTPHHIRPWGNGGGDAPENLLRLCFRHHMGSEGYHPLGRETWFARFRDRLLPEARAKVEAVITEGGGR